MDLIMYGIYFAGDAMGVSRSTVTIVSEEEARAHSDTSGWSYAVKIERLEEED